MNESVVCLTDLDDGCVVLELRIVGAINTLLFIGTSTSSLCDRVWMGVGEVRIVFGMGRWGGNWGKKDGFWGSGKVFSGAPGRGVLRFSGGGIQESRS